MQINVKKKHGIQLIFLSIYFYNKTINVIKRLCYAISEAGY